MLNGNLCMGFHLVMVKNEGERNALKNCLFSVAFLKICIWGFMYVCVGGPAFFFFVFSFYWLIFNTYLLCTFVYLLSMVLVS